MNNTRLKFRFNRCDWSNVIGLKMILSPHNGLDRIVAEPIVFKEQVEGSYIEDCLKITMEGAQNMMDELWLLGIRPSEGRGSAGAMAATQKHLEDMRKISFAILKKEGVLVDQKN